MYSRSATLRRLLLATLVVAACSHVEPRPTVAQACNMRADYVTVERAPAHGDIRLQWAYLQPFTGDHIGSTAHVGDGAIVSLAGAPPGFDDVCGLAKLGHNVLEAMGGRHQ
jgi:hypothetical protein